jgi:hypothetical protein
MTNQTDTIGGIRLETLLGMFFRHNVPPDDSDVRCTYSEYESNMPFDDVPNIHSFPNQTIRSFAGTT